MPGKDSSNEKKRRTKPSKPVPPLLNKSRKEAKLKMACFSGFVKQPPIVDYWEAERLAGLPPK